VSTNCEILISVRSEYAKKMLSGTKSVELRRRHVHVTPGTKIWIYSKAPHAAVLARAVVDDVVIATPSSLWKKYRNRIGVTYSEFKAYFGSLQMGCAILLRNIQKLKSVVTLATFRRKCKSFHPPQFYLKLFSTDHRLLFLKGRMPT
jgi:predicted transcriptional regulator